MDEGTLAKKTNVHLKSNKRGPRELSFRQIQIQILFLATPFVTRNREPNSKQRTVAASSFALLIEDRLIEPCPFAKT